MSLYDDERGCGGGRRASNKTRRLWLFMMFVSCLVRSLTKAARIFRIRLDNVWTYDNHLSDGL
jgi:hypothetical protein